MLSGAHNSSVSLTRPSAISRGVVLGLLLALVCAANAFAGLSPTGVVAKVPATAATVVNGAAAAGKLAGPPASGTLRPVAGKATPSPPSATRALALVGESPSLKPQILPPPTAPPPVVGEPSVKPPELPPPPTAPPPVVGEPPSVKPPESPTPPVRSEAPPPNGEVPLPPAGTEAPPPKGEAPP